METKHLNGNGTHAGETGTNRMNGEYSDAIVSKF
jgi:hypothetical protein